MQTRTAALGLVAILTSVTVSAQQKPTAASAAADSAVKGSGSLPRGWSGRLDAPGDKLDSVNVTAEKDALTFKTGPAGIYFKTDMKAEKDYDVSASFSQLDPAAQPEEYGIFIGGADLQKDTQKYTYFSIRQDGKYSIRKRSAATDKAVIDWRRVPSMREPKGVKTSNTLAIRAHGDNVRFFIGDKEVAKLTRAQVGGDGITGLRIDRNLHVQVSKFEVKKLQ
jgi:hypothetical protein